MESGQLPVIHSSVSKRSISSRIWSALCNSNELCIHARRERTLCCEHMWILWIYYEWPLIRRQLTFIRTDQRSLFAPNGATSTGFACSRSHATNSDFLWTKIALLILIVYYCCAHLVGWRCALSRLAQYNNKNNQLRRSTTAEKRRVKLIYPHCSIEIRGPKSCDGGAPLIRLITKIDRCRRASIGENLFIR